MSFLTPLALLGGLLSIPIVLLYMLRLRRREVVVSSTFLWQQIVHDNEANTPWQRLRRNLLLFLQLLILAAIVFALARPFIIVPVVTTGQIELLLDASASMNATDTADGATRFDEAQRQALSMVDTLGVNDTMTIIRVANVAEVIQPATHDSSMLRAAINSAKPSNAQADWVAALTLASADAVDTANFNMVIISDGGLGDASGLPGVPGKIQYIPVGQSDSNLAISALATRTLSGQKPQLFAQITNYGQRDADVIFDLRVDGNLFHAQRYTVGAGANLPIVSEGLPENFSVLEAGLTTPADSKVRDYLAQDNTAWAVSTGSGQHRALLMSDGNQFLEQVLRSLPGIQAFKGDVTRSLPTETYDLYILDGWLPPDNSLPDGDLLIINPPRSTALFTVGAESDQTGHILVKRDDPRTTFVDFKDVDILKFRSLTGANWADELIKADGGPLLLAGEQNGRQVAILTFDLHNSNLPLQIAWPILMANLLEWFTPRAAISVPNGLQVGQSLSILPPLDATSILFTLPDRSTRDMPIDRQTVVFADTESPGIYSADIHGQEKVIQSAQFAVNLFAPTESDIAPQKTLSLSGNTIAPAVREEVGQREFWPWAALLALIILLMEWYVYQRRLQVRTVFNPILRRRRAA
jgi:aerotolerance regulator-like protein/VWA domain-containing protein